VLNAAYVHAQNNFAKTSRGKFSYLFIHIDAAFRDILLRASPFRCEDRAIVAVVIGGIESYRVSDATFVNTAAGGNPYAGVIAANHMRKADLKVGKPLQIEISFEFTDAARSFRITSWVDINWRSPVVS
jgi:hypothetical protein